MTRDDIIRMAREAGCIPRRHPEYDNDIQVFATPDVLERFAALVLANTPPQSSMAWQEGYEAGRLAERESLRSVMRQMFDAYSLASDPKSIRARGNT